MSAAPSAVVDPRVAELSDHVRAAAESSVGLRIRGAGTWLDAGEPVAASRELAVTALTGIVEYVPGDYTITVRAGTSLDELRATIAANNQWLPLDPPAAAGATIGATISTASAGPLASGFGTPRDMVLGLQAITGDGRVIRAGGRVVKNVAGFDITRLLTGSWGTLAIITEISLRLRAFPEREATVAIGFGDSVGDLERMVVGLRTLAFRPMAAELLDVRTAAAVGLESNASLVVRVGGNAVALAAQLEGLCVLGSVTAADDAIWNRLASLSLDAASVVRWSAAPASFTSLWRDSAQLVDGLNVTRTASVARGIVRICGSSAEDALVRGSSGTTVIVERLPAVAWTRHPTVVTNAAISRHIKRSFDPAGILNPGMLGFTNE